MVRIGRIVSPASLASRMSTRNTDSPSVRLPASSFGRGAGQQQHQVGVLGARGPDLLAVDDVVVALAAGEGPDRGGVGAARGSVTPNACRRSSPDAMCGRYLALLLGAAVPQQRAHGVHLGVAGGAVAAGALDFLHDRRGGR